MSTWFGRWSRAAPTLLRVGFVHTLAYPAEFAIWMLTMTLPLVMLGLWTSVASEGPFGGYGEADFVAYYLAAFLVRNLTGNWVVWHINEEVRTGALMQRLLKPLHPFVTYLGTHLSAIPLRGLIALPLGAVMLVSSARDALITDAPRLGIFALSLVATFTITFFIMVAIGAIAFFVERSLAIIEIYYGVFSIFSGYIVPLDLFPEWLQAIADVLPFRYMLAFPVELLIGKLTTEQAMHGLGMQFFWVAITVPSAIIAWRAGVRRFEAYGA